MNKIEYRDNEDYPRYNGILMTPEECIKLYGFDGEFELFSDGLYSINDTTYTDKSFYDIVMLLGTVHGKVEEYDSIASQGRGYETFYFEKQLENTKNRYEKRSSLYFGVYNRDFCLYTTGKWSGYQ